MFFALSDFRVLKNGEHITLGVLKLRPSRSHGRMHVVLDQMYGTRSRKKSLLVA